MIHFILTYPCLWLPICWEVAIQLMKGSPISECQPVKKFSFPILLWF